MVEAFGCRGSSLGIFGQHALKEIHQLALNLPAQPHSLNCHPHPIDHCLIIDLDTVLLDPLAEQQGIEDNGTVVDIDFVCLGSLIF